MFISITKKKWRLFNNETEVYAVSSLTLNTISCYTFEIIYKGSSLWGKHGLTEFSRLYFKKKIRNAQQ